MLRAVRKQLLELVQFVQQQLQFDQQLQFVAQRAVVEQFRQRLIFGSFKQFSFVQ